MANFLIRDTTGTGDHFALEITSKLFTGKTLIEQHRMVLSTLNPFMEKNGGPIHAVEIKTKQ